jgi:hypothetical protein
MLHVNDDGKLNAKDLKAALAILLVTGVLFVIPSTAHAEVG